MNVYQCVKCGLAMSIYGDEIDTHVCRQSDLAGQRFVDKVEKSDKALSEGAQEVRTSLAYLRGYPVGGLGPSGKMISVLVLLGLIDSTATLTKRGVRVADAAWKQRERR